MGKLYYIFKMKVQKIYLSSYMNGHYCLIAIISQPNKKPKKITLVDTMRSSSQENWRIIKDFISLYY